MDRKAKGAAVKYVMLEVTAQGITRKIPILFPDMLVHLEVANAIKPLLERQLRNVSIEIVSAGFFNSNDVDIVCTGGSESCGVNAQDLDAMTIAMHDYLHGL
jgi:hypothetical protein